jgi:hypothetical protein
VFITGHFGGLAKEINTVTRDLIIEDHAGTVWVVCREYIGRNRFIHSVYFFDQDGFNAAYY